MPKEWHDRRAIDHIENKDIRNFYYSIVADKKPYFMRYIYPSLMKKYNAYTTNTNKSSLREFGMTIDDLISSPVESLTDPQRLFIKNYYNYMPVGIGDCVMNKICRIFENEFDGFLGRKDNKREFDYTIMKSGAEYSKSQYNLISKLYKKYSLRLINYTYFFKQEHMDEFDAFKILADLKDEFSEECDKVCPNRKVLCDILIDVCYKRNSTRRFIWDICADEIIENLLDKNNHKIVYPQLDPDGDIYFGGNKFVMKESEVSSINEYSFE